VGIVAAIARRSLYRVTCMCLFEGALLAIVAGKTKVGLFTFKEIYLL